MSITDSRGFLFSMDTAIACIIALGMLLIIISAGAQSINAEIKSEKEFALWKNIVFVSDSIVKNNIPGQSMFGSAVFDSEKHRVKSNEIDPALLGDVSGFSNPEFKLKKIKLVFEEHEETFFETQVSSKNCLVIERLVLVQGKKALLALEGCSE